MRSAADRHEDLLWGPVSHGVPVSTVLQVEHTESIPAALAEQTARLDDAFWARFARRLWVTPQGFVNWWIARRWAVPRDITKE